jgi:hypothetical protein
MSRESELGVAIWRLRDHAKLKDQQLAAADLLERFYDDVTLSMIARILRGERQKNELSERDQNIWVHVKILMSAGLNYEDAVLEAGATFNVSDKSVERAVTAANKAGLKFI